jgi:hypothetical protein
MHALPGEMQHLQVQESLLEQETFKLRQLRPAMISRPAALITSKRKTSSKITAETQPR